MASANSRAKNTRGTRTQQTRPYADGSGKNGENITVRNSGNQVVNASESTLEFESSSSSYGTSKPALAGFRHSAHWTYAIALIASVVALIVSFVLSAETLFLARNPNTTLSCDINSTLSCSAVANSWQAEFIRFGSLSFPNAFFGIAAESVFITIAVLGLTRLRFPRWFAIATWFGSLAALCYSYWLFTQSMFVIQALCPWCLLLMASTTVQFMAFSHASVTNQGLAKRTLPYYKLHIDMMVDVVWILAIATLILVVDGSAIFG